MPADTRDCTASGEAFTPADLGCWLALAASAGVPVVPAVEIASAPTADLYDTIDGPDASPTTEVIAFFKTVDDFRTRCGPGFMLRWSCCSMGDLKLRMASARTDWHPTLMELYVDDFRAAHLISEFPRDRITAFARPWLALDIIDGYPVEYRAFVADGRLQGISNYYPQRPLPDVARTADDVATVRRMTEALIEAQRLPLDLPQLEGRANLALNQFTADFVRLPSGAILLLEGGPPHTPSWGAHPCCFEGREISGVALAPLSDEAFSA